MEFGIARYVDEGAQKRLMAVVAEFENSLKAILKVRSYGKGVGYLLIGVAVFGEQGVKFFKKPRRPKFTPGKGKIIRNGAPDVEYDGLFEFEFWIDYDTFMQASDPMKLFSDELLNSLDILKLPGKVKDFDLKSFKTDLEQFFKERKTAF